MPRAVVYVRVSSDEQVKGMSLDFQKADCLAYAERKGLAVDRLFEERGESAKFADRPELIRLLERCRDRKRPIDALIVWKIDRLSRNQLDYYYLKRALLDSGVALHSATEPSVEDPNSIAGKVFETFSALQAEIDNTIRSERTRRGLEAKFAAGIYPFHPPVGYLCRRDKRAGRKKTLPDDPDPATFPIVQDALRRYARGGLTQTDLARLLDEGGLARARGAKTYPQLVSRLLRENLDFYAGYLRNPWTGERIRGVHKPMLTEEEALRIAAVRDGRSVAVGVRKRKDHPLFPLRRTVRCSPCGAFLTASVSRGNGGRFAYYHCPTKGCPFYGKGQRKADVEARFARLADSHALKTGFLPALKASIEEAVGREGLARRNEREIREKRLAALELKRKRIYEMREDGAYTQEEFMERRRAVEEEADALKLERAGETEEAGDMDAVFARAARFAESLGSGWAEMPFDLRRRFQNLLFPSGISYHPEKGFGTADPGLIFGLNREFAGGKSRTVPPAGVSWNRILTELRRMGEEMGLDGPPASSASRDGLTSRAE